MTSKEQFNKWANEYEKSVYSSDQNNTYPFAGYKKIIDNIYKEIILQDKANIFDIGFGTGILLSKLYDKGYNILGMDFFEKMIKVAKEKMPKAYLFKGDFSKELNDEIKKVKFDFIIATYSLHHLRDEEKIKLIIKLYQLLNENGSIIIGDIAFETRNELNKCKIKYEDEWDDEEYYFIYDDIKKMIPYENTFEKISFCSGVIRIKK